MIAGLWAILKTNGMFNILLIAGNAMMAIEIASATAISTISMVSRMNCNFSCVLLLPNTFLTPTSSCPVNGLCGGKIYEIDTGNQKNECCDQPKSSDQFRADRFAAVVTDMCIIMHFTWDWMIWLSLSSAGSIFLKKLLTAYWTMLGYIFAGNKI
jgi:hypothetical protein